MPPSFFPLRWESTGEQWWYASPIDWAAANGHYDLVRELLHLDTNLLIKLTSLRRIRRLETVWDDEEQFDDVAKCRSEVARKLFRECQTRRGHNSLLKAGYGGWLLYTAASAGDVFFVKELLDRLPLLVFGEGEYGVTDIFYAAARSKNSEVFRLLLDLSISPGCFRSSGEELEEPLGEVSPEFRWEIMNRATHAAARGGNLEILKELLQDCSDVLVYRDMQGSTILHTASGRGQVEVVKDLLSSFDIISSTDSQGNTALNVAAYRGYLAVVKALILASPSSTSLTNKYGDTFLHMAVAGFRSPSFRRMDRQIELMKQLVCGEIVNMEGIINVKNSAGRTALHMAVIGNIQSEVVELLMTVPAIDLNIRDADGMTPLDLLKQRPQSASSEILIKLLISAGGISNCQDYMARNALVSHLKMKGIGSSPGATFRISDAEIFLYSGIENASDASYDPASGEVSSRSSELNHLDSATDFNSADNKRAGSISNAATRLKILLQWPSKHEGRTEGKMLGDDDSFESHRTPKNLEKDLTPLRQRFSTFTSLPNNKRVVSFRNNLPSPSTKKKFTAGLMHGVIRAMPRLAIPAESSSPRFSESPVSSPRSTNKEKDVAIETDNAGPSSSNQSADGRKQHMNNKQASFNKKLMNQYFCFGAQDIAVENSIHNSRPHHGYRHAVV